MSLLGSRRILVLATLVALLFASAVSPATHAAPTAPNAVVIVKPSALNGWAIFPETGTPQITFVTGPATPPASSGSVRMVLPAAADGGGIAAPLYQGLRFDQLTTLSYSTYRSAPTAGVTAIAFQFNADYDLNDTTTAWQGRLVYEPYQTPGNVVTAGTWQTWNMLAGRWWGTGTPRVGNTAVAQQCPNANPCTTAQLLTFYPNLGIKTGAADGIYLKAGSSWAGFDGNVDNLHIVTSTGVDDRYDFEPDCPGGTVTNTNTAETFCSIQAAIDDADTIAGHKLDISAGTFAENVTVTKGVELAGAGVGQTIVHPATSGPTCTSGAGTYCAGSVHNILVKASTVTIHDLTVDGDNPLLTSTVVRGGADLDARTGISHDQVGGPYNNLHVYNTEVKNIYLRALYNSSTSSTGFYFHNNTIQNVRGDGGSIGIFSWVSSGRVEYNTVTDANDAIAANHSKGIQFIGNVVTNSDSGIHTDNFGDSGTVGADLLQGNQVSNCSGTTGYGIWVFVPYSQATVQQNTITDCEVGLALFGQAAATTPATQFLNNTVTGSGAGSYGAAVSTNTFGYGDFNATARLSGNTLSNVQVGIEVEETGSGFEAEAFVERNTITGISSTLADSYGVNILANAKATIGSATMDNSNSNDISDFATGVRIAGTGIVQGNFGSITDNATGIHVVSGGTSTVVANDILNSDVGLLYDSGATSARLYCNNIQSPSNVGVENNTGATFLGEYNYWDDPAGPNGPNGDKIVGTPIDYSPFSTQPVTVTTCETALAVLLDSLTATSNATGDVVTVAWTTISELDTLGFHLYRRAEGQAETRLNAAMIPATGGAQGMSYTRDDDTVVTGTTYTYRLESVATDGSATTLGEVSVTPSVPTAVTLGTVVAHPVQPWAATLALAGLSLVGTVALLRRRR